MRMLFSTLRKRCQNWMARRADRRMVHQRLRKLVKDRQAWDRDAEQSESDRRRFGIATAA